MSDSEGRALRAGGPITDLCRACKAVRDHTIMAVDAQGQAVRVVCDFCRSQHNYRGGGDEPRGRATTPAVPLQAPAVLGAAPAPAPPRLAVERERTDRVSASEDGIANASDLERLLRRVLREELGLTELAPAPKWRGGQFTLRPGKPGLQEKTWPIDALFHKVVMIRNRLRTLEQHLNAAEIPEDLKLRLQGYISGCYGSLTSFNVLFADEADQFKGGGGGD